MKFNHVQTDNMQQNKLFYTKRLSDIIENNNYRKNNFDFIRFFAALIVILSHSFPISYGPEISDPLKSLTGSVSFGLLGVYIFFIISGFLILISFQQSKNIRVFFIKRFLRIYPALIIVVFITVFLLGPLISNLQAKDYFTNSEIYKYLITSTIFVTKYKLPGIFNNNPYPHTINGSLWTLKYEMFCYIIIALLGILKLLKKTFIILSIITCIFLNSIMNIFELNQSGLLFTLYYIFHFYIFFGSGALFYIFRKHIILDYRLFIISTLLLALLSITPIFNIAIAFLGSYVIFYFSFVMIPNLNNFARYGDFSYGMYIYAFPVQQTFAFIFSNNHYWLFNVLIATPIILVCAIFSWYLIEKKALSLKPK